jgi:ABC-type transporter Mla MlaB component
MATRLVIVDCARIAKPSAGSIDQLARLSLITRREGCECRLANCNEALLELIALSGLSSVLGVDSGREPEQREQACRVEEKRQLGDLPV